MHSQLSKKTVSRVWATVLAVALTSSIGQAYAQDGDTTSREAGDSAFYDPYAVYESEDEARYADVVALATETGLGIDEIEVSVAFQEAFSDFADEQMKKHPEKIAGIWMQPVPQMEGHIRYVGKIPVEAGSELEARGLSRREVLLTGGDRISLHTQMTRTQIAVEALLEAGHNNAMVNFDPRDARLHVTIQQPSNAYEPSKADIAGRIRHRLATDRGRTGENRFPNEHALMFEERDLVLDVVTRAGPLMALHQGGAQLKARDLINRNILADNCTSGWSVSGSAGNGIITAAHCSRTTAIRIGSRVHDTHFVNQHEGAMGDVEYHTVDTPVVAEFNASETEIRDVTGWKSTSSMLGGLVCSYGRASNRRTCNHTVRKTGVWTISDSGKVTGNMVIASNNTSIDGDSGGGWSWGTTAWGVHSGTLTATNESAFTPISGAIGALAVRLLTK